MMCFPSRLFSMHRSCIFHGGNNLCRGGRSLHAHGICQKADCAGCDTGTFDTAFSTRVWQAAQLMPVTLYCSIVCLPFCSSGFSISYTLMGYLVFFYTIYPVRVFCKCFFKKISTSLLPSPAQSGRTILRNPLTTRRMYFILKQSWMIFSSSSFGGFYDYI